MACLDSCCGGIKKLFDEHAGEDGLLNKDELKKMIEGGVKNPKIKEKLLKADLDTVMEKMDKNDDGSVDFKEFCKFVCFVAKCHHRECHQE